MRSKMMAISRRINILSAVILSVTNEIYATTKTVRNRDYFDYYGKLFIINRCNTFDGTIFDSATPTVPLKLKFRLLQRWYNVALACRRQ